LQPFPRQSTHFFLRCVNCLFRFRCPQTFFLRVFFYRPPPSIDTLSLLRVDCLFFNCRCAQTPRHLLCVERTFSTSQVHRQRQAFLSYRLIPLFLHLPCVDCAFSISAAHSFSSINWDTAISVEFLVLQLFFVFRRFFVACADTSFVQAKQRLP